MKLTYRPEIDGLRAIAVGAVILYHAQINIFGQQLFKGGFIGVDIFFVISGYLITSIIFKELVTTGSFSFKNFYERRIRRILPVLLFIMLISLPFAWIYLMPSNFVDFSKSILYSLGFSSNFYFWHSGLVYGTDSGLFKPFLHTWSLSVEEQYYILFPIVLLIIYKYCRNFLIHTLILGLVISLVLADWGSRNYPSASFYFLHTRMWELLIGSILSYFEIIKGYKSKSQSLNLILPFLGLILIGHSFLFYNDKMFHPSFYTLSPIIGVCLIIWYSNKEEWITKILSTKLFVGIGLISYSLYLWHYPVFAFARILEFTESSTFNKLLLGIIILIFSILSYYFVELPFRNKKNNFKIIISLILLIFSFLIISNLNIISKNGYKNRLPEILKNISLEPPYLLLKNLDNKSCGNEIIEECKFNKFSNKKIYIIGDSHMASIMYDLKDKIVEKQYQFITSVLPSCVFSPGFDLINIKTNKITTCNNQYFQKLKKTLSKEKNSIFIFGGRFQSYLTNTPFDNLEGGFESENILRYIQVAEYDNIQNSFRNEVSKLSKNNKIILIYPIPEVGWNVPKKIFKNRKIFSQKFDFKEITTSFEVFQNRTASGFELLNTIQGDDIYRVYPHKLFCDTRIKDRCVTHDDKNFFYFDSHHPSLKGAEMINDLIMKEIEKIELKSN
jgi:peptidoglycan/LPS O-acetylase OafA/YrhL